MILWKSFSLQGILEVHGPKGSTSVYNGLLTNCNEMVRFKTKPFAYGNYPAAETRKFVHAVYASEENMGHNDKMLPGKADAYVAQKVSLKHPLFAINCRVIRMSCNNFFVLRPPEH